MRDRTEAPQGSGVAWGAVGVAANSAKARRAQIGQTDQMLEAQDRTNQLLEWIGLMVHELLTPEQQERASIHL